MGGVHARNLQSGSVGRATLGAVCDRIPAKTEPFGGVPACSSSEKLIAARCVDAMLVATPHFSHTTIGAAALEAGYHVLVEKPISVHKADCEKLIAARRDASRVFAAMFNQRTDPRYLQLREMVRSGKLGAPFFPRFINDLVQRTEEAMSQEHAFKAAELSMQAQQITDRQRQ